jgi:hypothetical protein
MFACVLALCLLDEQKLEAGMQLPNSTQQLSPQQWRGMQATAREAQTSQCRQTGFNVIVDTEKLDGCQMTVVDGETSSGSVLPLSRLPHTARVNEKWCAGNLQLATNR